MSTKRRTIARETVEIIEQGFYTLHADSLSERVDIATDQAYAEAHTKTYTPEELDTLVAEAITEIAQKTPLATEITVTDETTLGAARRWDAEGREGIAALNFASAKNAGGGFLKGSQAQEESLARASGLYGCIAPQRLYYTTHRSDPSFLYSDHMIYSPNVPVFRDDNDELIAPSYLVSMVTSAAVNVSAMNQQRRDKEKKQVEEAMRKRIAKLLALLWSQGQKNLVLGAWGCGVFGNDPRLIARLFHEHLCGGAFTGAFDAICFAIYERGKKKENTEAFSTVFSPQ